MECAELVFIPAPGVGHLVSMVEIAKLLICRDQRLSITLLIMNYPLLSHHDTSSSDLQSLLSTSTRTRLVELRAEDDISSPPGTFLSGFIDRHKAPVRDAVGDMLRSGSSTRRLAGFVIDMFCTPMIDVADEFGLPTYIFFTSGAASLGLMLHLQSLQEDQNLDITEFKESDELSIPCFANLVPAKVLPAVALDKNGGSVWFLDHARRFKETKGIIINTFMELESFAIKSLQKSYGSMVPIYPVGPILKFSKDDDRNGKSSEIMKWLDDQPPSSVVFLCFGSMGTMDANQVEEIAMGLENSGQRFLWSLRRPPQQGEIEFPSEYTDHREMLPEGFMERTAKKGKVIGWAPQVAVLSHPAVGGFVSHCGWNSTLESIWCGVSVATWPLYAEQQLNAFQMVRELGLAAEIRVDYKRDFWMSSGETVRSEEIEKGIRRLMGEDGDGERCRNKVREMKEKSRMALTLEVGSSYASLGRFIEEVIKNIPSTS